MRSFIIFAAIIVAVYGGIIVHGYINDKKNN